MVPHGQGSQPTLSPCGQLLAPHLAEICTRAVTFPALAPLHAGEATGSPPVDSLATLDLPGPSQSLDPPHQLDWRLGTLGQLKAALLAVRDGQGEFRDSCEVTSCLVPPRVATRQLMNIPPVGLCTRTDWFGPPVSSVCPSGPACLLLSGQQE
jgi:hypothetical protein